MKIVCTVAGRDLSSPLDPRFGRTDAFLVYDTEGEGVEVIANRNISAAHGAGIQAAETVVRTGARVLLTGRCGPKAFRVLEAAGITVYLTDAATASQAITLFREGKLCQATAADSRGKGA